MRNRIAGRISGWLGVFLCTGILAPAFLPAQAIVHVAPGDTILVVGLDTVTVPPPAPVDVPVVTITSPVANGGTLNVDVGDVIRFEGSALTAVTGADVTSTLRWVEIQAGGTPNEWHCCGSGVNRTVGSEDIHNFTVYATSDTLIGTAQFQVVAIQPGSSLPDTTENPPEGPGEPPAPPPSGGGGSSPPGDLPIPSDHSHAGPNEPSGMTPAGLVDFSTGTLVPRSASCTGTCMYDHSVSGISVQMNASSQTGMMNDPVKGQVVQFHMPTGCMNGGGHSCGNNMWGWTKKKYRTMYIKYVVWFDPEMWVNKPGNKWLGQLGGTPTSPKKGLNYHIKPYPNGSSNWGNSGNIHIMLSEGGQHCGTSRNFNGNSLTLPRNGQWHVIEIVATASSGECVPDGEFTLWLDGQLAVHATNVPTWDTHGQPEHGAAWWQGVKITPIMGGNCTSSTLMPCPTANHRLRFAEFYASGKDER